MLYALFFGNELHILGLTFDILQLCQFDDDFLKVSTIDGETRGVLTALSDVVCLIKDDDGVFEFDLEVFANLLIDQIVVWHKYDISTLSPIFHGEVWAEAL